MLFHIFSLLHNIPNIWVNFQDWPLYITSLSVFTLTSMGWVSVGQSNLRRALPPWFIVQYPVILTSGRGNLKMEGHMVTSDPENWLSWVENMKCIQYVFVFLTVDLGPHVTIFSFRKLWGSLSTFAFNLKWTHHKTISDIGLILLWVGFHENKGFNLKLPRDDDACVSLLSMLCLIFTGRPMNHSWIVATALLAAGGG